MGYQVNRMSGVALAMHHRLSGLSTHGLKGQCAGDEHPTYTPQGMASLPFTLYVYHHRVNAKRKYWLQTYIHICLLNTGNKPQLYSKYSTYSTYSKSIINWKMCMNH